jgi:hypothetical protein
MRKEGLICWGPKLGVDSCVNVNTTDATTGATALLLPAQNTRVNVNTTDATTNGTYGTGTASLYKSTKFLFSSLVVPFPHRSTKSSHIIPAILRSSALGNSFSRKRYTYCVMLSQVQVWELGFRVALIKTTYPVLTSVLSEKICFGWAGRVNSVIPSDQDCLTKAGSASSWDSQSHSRMSSQSPSTTECEWASSI